MRSDAEQDLSKEIAWKAVRKLKNGTVQPAENIELKWEDFGHHHSMGLEYEGKQPQFGRAQRAKVSVVEVGNNLLLYQ